MAIHKIKKEMMKKLNTKSHMPNIRNGFTLVEIAIVLIIIGLITASVFAGKELIDASRISSVAAQMVKYQSAYNKYKDQYNAVPGDHNGAWDYWGTDCAVDEATCDGDGDRFLDFNDENFMFFRHLYLAELMGDNLTGVIQGSSPYTIIGTNAPFTYLTGKTLFPVGMTKINFFLYAWEASPSGARTNFLALTKVQNNGYAYTEGVTPTIAKKIDTKIDDGKPGTGIIIGGDSALTSTTGCSDNASTSVAAMRAAEYRVSITNEKCAPGIALE